MTVDRVPSPAPPAPVCVLCDRDGRMARYETIEAALDAGARCVYLSPGERARHRGRLAQGQVTHVAYGFCSVSLWVEHPTR